MVRAGELECTGRSGLSIWTWVILGALVVETLFVLYGTVIWRREPLEGAAETIETPQDVGEDD